MQLTPETIGDQIETAASYFRKRDQEVLAIANQNLTRTFNELKAIAQNSRSAYEQWRWVQIVGCVCFLGGLMAWALLAQIGAILR